MIIEIDTKGIKVESFKDEKMEGRGIASIVVSDKDGGIRVRTILACKIDDAEFIISNSMSAFIKNIIMKFPNIPREELILRFFEGVMKLVFEELKELKDENKEA